MREALAITIESHLATKNCPPLKPNAKGEKSYFILIKKTSFKTKNFNKFNPQANFYMHLHKLESCDENEETKQFIPNTQMDLNRLFQEIEMIDSQGEALN